jgi:hypothetical protein
MREQTLAAFFKGTVSARELARDLEGSVKRVDDGGFIVEIEDMQDELAVTSEMAIALCDAVLAGELPPEASGNDWVCSGLVKQVLLGWRCGRSSG